MRHCLLLTSLLLSAALFSFAQDSTNFQRVINLPDKLLGALEKKTSAFRLLVNCQTNKYLSKLQKNERKLQKKLWKKDSTLARHLFADTDSSYARLKKLAGSMNTNSGLYSRHLDSLSTALRFLQSNQLVTDPALQKTIDQYKDLQNQLNVSAVIKQQLAERQQFLRQQLQNAGMVKELGRLRKELYYYQAQVQEYKELLEDPNKMEAKLMQLVTQIPRFRDFFARNSALGSMFRLPVDNEGSPASLEGLQTRAQINQLYADRFGSSPDIAQQIQNTQSTRLPGNTSREQPSLARSGSLANGADRESNSFRPNSQKTKSFLKRLEYGANFQSQRARFYFPVTSDVGLSLGYKLNDKAALGIGAAYKLGLGTGWNNIRLTHQGLGLRSYIDWKLKGSLYITGGYEQNYNSLFNSIGQLRDYSAWRSSGLLGLSKKYRLGKKMKGDMKLLWDFLSYRQAPRTQAIFFRFGYSLK